MPTPALPAPLRDALRTVRSVGAITGAGVSAESGIRTYRGRGGVYDDPAEGDRTVEALSGPTLRADPDRTWRALVRMARESRDARPNAAHRALVEIEARVERFVLLTQNVDGLHQAAGSRNVIAIHGDLLATTCLSCGQEGRLGREELGRLEGAPACFACGGTLRPRVVLFGEMLPQRELLRLEAELLKHPPDLLLVAGTTALFPYIQYPVLLARQAGRLTVEINPEPADLSEVVDWSLRGRAGELLPLVAAALGG